MFRADMLLLFSKWGRVPGVGPRGGGSDQDRAFGADDTGGIRIAQQHFVVRFA